MIADIFPIGVVATGHTRWIVTPAFPGTLDTKAVSREALNGDSALDITCYIAAEDQEIEVSQDTETDTRACDTSQRKAFATPEFTKESIQHIVDPQAEPGAQGNKAKGAIPADSTIYVTLYMSGKDWGGEVPENALVDVYQIVTGAEHISPRENGKYKREVKTSFTRVVHGAKVVA